MLTAETEYPVTVLLAQIMAKHCKGVVMLLIIQRTKHRFLAI